MDNLTHLALGAVIGQTVAYRRLGRTALALGAIANTIPDIDVVGNALGSLAEWQYHRGITHSLFFGPLIGPMLGYAVWRAFRRWRPQSSCADPASLGPIITVLTVAMVAHPLLDFFTVYGTQLLAPFSNTRFAVSGVAVIDPIYTLIVLVGAILGLVRWRWTAAAGAAALVLSSGFLFYAWEQNHRAEAEARSQLLAQGMRVADLRAYTTIFQPWLRRIVVQEEGRVRVGFVSTWLPAPIPWTCLPRAQDPLIERAFATPEVQILARFAPHQTWPELRRDEQGHSVVRFTDLRYGAPGSSIAGWWGIDVTFDAAGAVEARRIAVPRPPLSWATVVAVYRGGLGDIAGFYAASGARMEQDASGC
jgi:inner membrane protein